MNFFLCVLPAQIAQDCCIKVAGKRFPLQILQSYTIQDAGQGCSISATVYVKYLYAFSGKIKSFDEMPCGFTGAGFSYCVCFFQPSV